jgi:hypothetical protein
LPQKAAVSLAPTRGVSDEALQFVRCVRFGGDPVNQSSPLPQQAFVADIERRVSRERLRGRGNEKMTAVLPEVFDHFGHNRLRGRGDCGHFTNAGETTNDRALGCPVRQRAKEMFCNALPFRRLTRFGIRSQFAVQRLGMLVERRRNRPARVRDPSN